MKKFNLFLMACLLGLSACVPVQAVPMQAAVSTSLSPRTDKIPNFDHIILMVFENRDYKDVIGSTQMPHLNALAKQNVLLSNYFAITHPSLPNYLALVSGSTQEVTSDCTQCFSKQPNLADRLEAGGRSWKTY